MATAYLILAHKLPRQVFRLAKRLSDGGGPVWLHVDRKSRQLFEPFRRALDQLDNVTVTSETSVAWGHASMLRVMMRGIDVLIRDHPEITHIKHLSGQDFPLRPPAEFDAFLARYRSASLLEHFAAPFAGWIAGGEPGGGLDRVRFLHCRFGDRVRRTPISLPIPRGYQLFVGSALWCLCREHARFILERRGALYKRLRWAGHPDEMFFQTALANSPFAGDLVNNDYTFVKWQPDQPSPSVLESRDIYALRESGCWFARKFDDSVDAGVLDLIEAGMSV